MVRFVLGLALLASYPTTARAAAPALMPLPVQVETRSGALAIDNTFSISTAGCTDPRIAPAAERLAARIARQTAIPMLGEPAVKLTVECAADGAEYPALGEDESYTLDVTPSRATLNAATAVGALRGMETFAQAIVPGAAGVEVPAMRIQATP